MKKKLLFGLLAVVMCFILVGCGQKEEEPKNEVDEIINSIKDGGDSTAKDGKEPLNDIDLYSDDTRLVFKFSDISTMVFYYEDDKIINLEYYYNYGTEYLATLAKDSIDQSNDHDIEKVEQKGAYIIVKYKESAYKDMTVEEVKQTYSYLEQIYE